MEECIKRRAELCAMMYGFMIWYARLIVSVLRVSVPKQTILV
jgi:hypothetical protein